MKVKVLELTQADIDKIKQQNIIKCKAIYSKKDFVTLEDMANKTRLSVSFIQKNWEAIIK